MNKLTLTALLTALIVFCIPSHAGQPPQPTYNYTAIGLGLGLVAAPLVYYNVRHSRVEAQHDSPWRFNSERYSQECADLRGKLYIADRILQAHGYSALHVRAIHTADKNRLN